MKKTEILLLIINSIFISIMFVGCNSIAFQKEEKKYPVVLPQFAIDYLQKLGDIEYLTETDINLEGTKDLVGLYVQNAKRYDDRKAALEWKIGGVSSLISNIVEDKYINKTIIDNSIDSSAVLIDLKNYTAYTFGSEGTGLSIKTKIRCVVFIEKGTEKTEYPHMYIWSYYIVSGISRVGSLIPSDQKIYTNYIEIGGER